MMTAGDQIMVIYTGMCTSLTVTSPVSRVTILATYSNRDLMPDSIF